MAIKTKTRDEIMSSLPAEVIIALGKAIRKEEVAASSSEMIIGETEVDMLIRISGTLTKGEDFEQRVVAKAQPWDIVAVALSKLNGVTVESLIRESMGMEEAKVTEIKEQAKAAMSKIKSPTNTIMNGRISPKLTIEVVD